MSRSSKSIKNLRYCKIKMCKHEVGTRDKSIPFTIVPRHGKMRNKWIEAINEYQEFDYYTGSFFLCSLHFKKDAFEQKNNRYRLKKDVIPSIFPPHKIPRPTMKPTSPIQFVEEVEEVEHMVIEPTIYDLHQSNDPHEAVCSSEQNLTEEASIQNQEGHCIRCTNLEIELCKATERITALENGLKQQALTLTHAKNSLAVVCDENRRLREQQQNSS